eukprot:1308021-Pleurochrysis_carterae.AAC.1
MPNEAVIQHRIVRWQAVWTELREEALAILLIEYFGARENGVTPKALPVLKERPNRLNFGASDECEKAKLAWAELRAVARTLQGKWPT